MERPAWCSVKVVFFIRSLYAVIGILLGLIVCAVFNVVFPNPGAAYLGLVSSLFALVCLVQYVYVYVRTDVQQRLTHVPAIGVFALIGAAGIGGGLGATIIFLGLGIVDSVNHVPDLPLTRTHYLAAVWGFTTFKWGLIGFIQAIRTFRKRMRSISLGQQEPTDDEAALIQGDQPINSTTDA